jgi:predicted nucleic acid-binding protein
MIVIDASVAAKWLLPEAGSQEAVALQEGPDELFGPDLIRLEVAAAITRRVRAKDQPLPPNEAIRRCAAWFRLLDRATISLLPESEVIEPAIRLAAELRHPLQDCMYLAAARQLDCPIITADRPLFERARPAYPRITMLSGCERN